MSHSCSLRRGWESSCDLILRLWHVVCCVFKFGSIWFSGLERGGLQSGQFSSCFAVEPEIF